jgi:hypothetical protein
MKKADQFQEAENALGARSRHKAEAERKCVSGDRLARAIAEYIEWRTFAYWVRLAAEKKGKESSCLETALRDRCPGFLEQLTEHRNSQTAAREFLWLQLIEWIDSHIFDYTKVEGWQHALGYYATRDERLDRVRAYWMKCDEEWERQPSPILPEYEIWRRAALQPS